VVLRDSLVETVVFFFTDLTLLSQPDGLDFVDGFPFPDLFSHSLGLLLLGFLLLTFVLNFSIIFLNFLLFSGLLSLGILISSWLGLFLIFFNLLSDFLGDEKLDWVLDELGVFLHEILDLILLNIFYGVILQVKSNASTSA
jgi:hypothetical protein